MGGYFGGYLGSKVLWYGKIDSKDVNNDSIHIEQR